MQPQHILVADDEPELIEILTDYLEAEGYAVTGVETGEEAVARVRDGAFDCVVLDVMLPGMSGFEACRAIRAFSDVPILFLSARGEDADKIRGLGLGGDDYVAKPFSPPEVVARVKALLRRYRPSAEQWRFGPLTIDPKGYRVWRDGREVAMTAKELELLIFLARHPGQVFSREQLYDRVWGDFGDPRTVTVHINRIREKIEADPSRPQFIQTVRGLGYRFTGVPR
ncbi:response regulator transcription factor [Symbiobacterium thermophilum]|uniref:Stage 0 sporulation protein A homolog n=2 Tax=Symbiobacterium thermophilum TaxID=2734 RepID=Q67RL8_SYMTH|nr:response regulator transcription factor [Symbiobacterium thermophilum]MBY6274722.1 DNA-binding response regulator [Symbiobacterium thermophilum]BAD39675.1 two-component response regulator [Symbiobacterium thermophilum IAM 14863]